MAVNPIVQVAISLQTSGVSRAGFGTPLFIGAHRWFSERVRTYSSISAAEDDIPTDSEEYQALLRAFQQSPSPTQVKIGRREADVTLTPQNVAENTVYTVNVGVNDGDSIAVTYTQGAGETAEDVVDAIKAAIDGDAQVAAHVTTTKNGTGASTTLTIEATLATDYFVISNLSNLGYEYSSTEVAADVLVAIEEEDSDFYGVSAHDHTSTFVLAMAAAVEARDKLYFVSTQEAASLTAYNEDTSTDIGAELRNGNYLNTIWFFHHEADTVFPEVAYFSYNAPYDPGKVVWVNNQINGLSVSRNPTTNKVLTLTEQNYINDRYGSWIVRDQGVDITRGGKTSKGEWIDVVRSKHFWKARLTEGLKNLLINQQGSKIGYNNAGIARILSKCNSVSDLLLSTDEVPNALDSYEFNFPRAENVSFEDKQSRILRGTFKGYLTGAVVEIAITGVLTYEGL